MNTNLFNFKTKISNAIYDIIKVTYKFFLRRSYMFRIAICDDENLITHQIESILTTYKKEKNLKIEISTFSSGNKLIEYIEKNKRFDLIYLDIEMDEMSGIEVARKIREVHLDHKTDLVFISGKDHYDRQLLGLQPLHFIRKPIDEKIVIKDLKLALLREEKLAKNFSYKKTNESYNISLSDILYFESIGRKIRIVTLHSEDDFYGNMKEVLEEVNNTNFIQIHKSYLINYEHTAVFKYEEVEMSNGHILPISQSKRKEIRAIQLRLMEE